MRRNAFTLIELLVAVAIISVLAMLLLPSLQRSMESARLITCSNNLKQIGIGREMYADEFSGRFPQLYDQIIQNAPFAYLNPRVYHPTYGTWAFYKSVRSFTYFGSNYLGAPCADSFTGRTPSELGVFACPAASSTVTDSSSGYDNSLGYANGAMLFITADNSHPAYKLDTSFYQWNFGVPCGEITEVYAAACGYSKGVFDYSTPTYANYHAVRRPSAMPVFFDRTFLLEYGDSGIPPVSNHGADEAEWLNALYCDGSVANQVPDPNWACGRTGYPTTSIGANTAYWYLPYVRGFLKPR